MQIAMILILSAISTFIVTYFVRRYALKKAILDIPNHRSSHTIPTPRGAGIAVALVFFVGVAALTFMHLIAGNLASALLIGGFLVAIIGYFDDLKGLPARVRAIFHLAAAIITVVALHGIPNLQLDQWDLHLGIVGSVLAVLTIMWMINLYNFMDGIDGISGIEALFVSLASAMILGIHHSHGVAFIGYLIAGISVGFLIWNWAPAKIFLGDVGSGLFGFIFAVLALESTRVGDSTIFFWFILLGVFIFDATFTLAHRLYRKQRFYHAHRDHVYQRLTRQGFSHAKVASIISIVNILILLPLAYLCYSQPEISFWLFLLTTAMFAAIWYLLVRKMK